MCLVFLSKRVCFGVCVHLVCVWVCACPNVCLWCNVILNVFLSELMVKKAFLEYLGCDKIRFASAPSPSLVWGAAIINMSL